MSAGEIIVELAGVPEGKARPRFSRLSGAVYTPAHTAKFETSFRVAAGQAMDGRPPLDGPLAVVVTVALPIPQSWSGKKRRLALAGAIRPTSRPDLDNYIKIAADACNEIVFRDDSQIVTLTAAKFYSERPYLRLEARPASVVADMLAPRAERPAHALVLV